MKILFVTDTYFPVISGSALIVERYAKELTKRGHQIAILAMGNKLNLTSKKISGNLTVYSVPSLKNVTRADHFIPLILPWQLKKIAKDFNPNLIHIFSPGTLGIWLKRHAKKNNVKVVMSCFGVPEFATSFLDFLPKFITEQANNLLWKYYVRFYTDAEATTVLSDFPKKELISHGVKTKIEVVPMWVDNSKKCPPKKSALLEKYKIPAGKKIILYLGRLDKDKDLGTLIKGFSQLLQITKGNQRPLLVLAGGGKERQGLEKLVTTLHLVNDVTFTGSINPERVHELYCISDIFVMPGPYETQSIATIQAIAYGLKAIVANSGALPEIQKRLPGECFTYKVSDPRSLAEEMKKLLDKPLQKHFVPGEFHKFYSLKSSIDKLEKVYHFALAT